MDTTKEPEVLVTVSIELENPCSDEISHICLGGMRMRKGNMNSPGGQMDGSNSQMGKSRGQTEASNVLNSAKTVGISHGDSTGAYLDARGARHSVEVMDGIGSHADISIGHRDVTYVETNLNTAADTPEII